MSTWKILFLMGGVVLGAFVAWPWQSDISVLEAELTTAESTLKLSQAKLQQLREAETLSQESPEELLGQIPRTAQQDEVIKLLDYTAQQNGFKVNQMSFSQRDDKGLRAQVLSTNATLEGNVNTLSQLLASLERAERFVQIETLNVKRSSDEGSNRATVSLAINTYSNLAP